MCDRRDGGGATLEKETLVLEAIQGKAGEANRDCTRNPSCNSVFNQRDAGRNEYDGRPAERHDQTKFRHTPTRDFASQVEFTLVEVPAKRHWSTGISVSSG